METIFGRLSIEFLDGGKVVTRSSSVHRTTTYGSRQIVERHTVETQKEHKTQRTTAKWCI